jgi:hypothetical protein
MRMPCKSRKSRTARLMGAVAGAAQAARLALRRRAL